MMLAGEAADEEEMEPIPEMAEDNHTERGSRRRGTIMIVLTIVAVALASSGLALLTKNRPSSKDDVAEEVEKVIQASIGDEPSEEKHDVLELDPLLNRNQQNNITFDDIHVYDGPVTNFIVANSTRTFNVRDDDAPTSTRSNGCKSNEGRVKFTLATDLYAFETTWSISDRSGQVVASGPPPASSYARETRYIGFLCLEQGRYRLKINDMMGDGICCSYGQGKLSIKDDQGKALAETGNEKFLEKNFQFRVVAKSPQQPNQAPPSLQGKAECSILNKLDYNGKVQVRSAATFPDYPCYRSVAGTNSTVDALVMKYPTLASKVVLNKYPTAERKLSLYSLVITNKQFTPNAPFGDKGKLLAISSIHAQELSTAETMLRFAEYLVQNYGKDPDLDWILDYHEIHLIFHANPDGRTYLERGGEKRLWRKNRNDRGDCDHWRFGVDPNRNFPFKWGQCLPDNQRCSSKDECQDVNYIGPAPRSEQETRAILEYASSIFPASQRKGNLNKSERQFRNAFSDSNEGVFLDVHSYGDAIGWPWGFINERTPNDDAIGAMGRRMASFSGYKLWAPLLPNRRYGFDGGTVDTLYGWHGVSSFFYELGTTFYQTCDTFPEIINKVFPGFLYAAKMAKTPFRTPLGPDILCAAFNKSNGYVQATVSASDDKRIAHADDGDNLFRPGRQKVKFVEAFLNCHPYSGCDPIVQKTIANPDRSKTVSFRFLSPDSGKQTLYVRARDSAGNEGAVSAYYLP